MATISGTVVDGVGNPVSRVVRLYRQDSGAFVAQAVSDATTGVYSFTVANTDTHFVVAQDNANLVDPYWASVVFMLELPATNDGTSFPDKTGKTVTRAGSGVLTKTGTTKYGPASVYFPGTGYLQCNAVAAALVGAAEFTIDGWFNAASDFSGSDGLFGVHTSSGGNRVVVTNLQAFGDGAFSTASFPALVTASLGQWVHVALEYFNGAYYVYRNGAIVTSNVASSNTIAATDLFSLGQEFNSGPAAANYFNGYVDNRFRVTKAARYKGAEFTPDTTLALTNLISSVTKNAVIFDAVVPV